VSGGQDNLVRVWDATTGDCLEVLEGHSADVTSLCVLPNGGEMATGSRDNAIRIWGLHSMYMTDARPLPPTSTHPDPAPETGLASGIGVVRRFSEAILGNITTLQRSLQAPVQV
jgi:WD40 repeat protein